VRRAALLAGACLLLIPAIAIAAVDFSGERARELLDRGRAKEAVALLKDAIAAQPATARDLRLLLARAYLAEGNDFWALRTLAEMSEQDPSDGEASLWAAWIHLRQGSLEAAREVLADITCLPGSACTARKALVSSQVERHAGHSALASRLLGEALGAPSAYPEDREAMARFAIREPAYVPVLTGRVDLRGGWVSNALTGSPADPTAVNLDVSSPAGEATLWVRAATPAGGEKQQVRPIVEFQARSSGYTRRMARDLGHVTVGVRPAFMTRGGLPRFLAGYRYEASQVVAGDRYDRGPQWFHAAQRGEFEAEFPGGWMVFGGAGRRQFREMGRSRIEFDGGLAGSRSLGRRLRLVAVLTGRRYLAEKDPYHLWGASGLVSMDSRLAAGWSLRTAFSGSQDAYPASTGYFDPSRAAVSRRETTLKGSGALHPPAWGGVQFGAVYEVASRMSRIDAYDYLDHRVFVRVTWSFASPPGLPRTEEPPGHVALDYGTENGVMDERVQDLLRQDESVQRSSSCLD
jgi:hypothetical protein